MPPTLSLLSSPPRFALAFEQELSHLPCPHLSQLCVLLVRQHLAPRSNHRYTHHVFECGHTDPQLLEKMLEKNVVIPPEAGEMSENVRKCSVFAAGGPPWGAPPSAFFGFSHPEGTGLVLKLRAGGRRPSSQCPHQAAKKAGLFVSLWLETKEVAGQNKLQVCSTCVMSYECIMCIANRSMLCMFPCGRIQC